MNKKLFKIFTPLTIASLSIFPIVTSCAPLINPVQITIVGDTEAILNNSIQYKIESAIEGACLDVDWFVISLGGEATIDSKGVLMPTKVGQISITAISKLDKMITNTLDVMIYAQFPNHINIEGPDAVDIEDDNQVINATIEPQGQCPAGYRWSVEDESILTINSDGKIIPHSLGKTKIICQSTYKETIKESLEISIVEAPTNIKILGFNSALVNCNQQYQVIVGPETSYKNIEWKIQPESSATFNPSTLTLTPKVKGQITLTACSQVKKSIQDEIKIDVSDVVPTAISITGETTIKLGKKQTYSATVEPVGSPQSVYWSVKSKSGNGYAAITSDGVLTPIRSGVVTLTATSIDNNISQSIDVTIDANTDNAFCTDPWTTVVEAASQGFNHLKEVYGLDTFVGLEKTIVIYGNNHIARVIGENCDSLVNGNGKAALTFEICTPIAESFSANGYKWDSNEKNIWNHDGTTCSLRQLLNSEIKTLINTGLGFDDASSPIKDVYKETCIGNETSDLATTPESVWLLSTTESGVKKSIFSTPEGTCYTYYSGINSFTSSVLAKKTYINRAASYWFRSPDISSSNEVWMCFESGSVNINNVGGSKGIAPCFCL